jgi:hypothetical protein
MGKVFYLPLEKFCFSECLFPEGSLSRVQLQATFDTSPSSLHCCFPLSGAALPWLASSTLS